MRTTHTYSRRTSTGAKLLGLEIARARRERRWTLGELAERAGVSAATARQVERGAPTVALGTFFEMAVLVGVDLFDVDGERLDDLVQRGRDRLRLLPARVRESSRPVRDDF